MKYHLVLSTLTILLILGTVISPPVYETPEIVRSTSVNNSFNLACF